MQRFAVFDIDGTIIRWQLYHAVVNELVKVSALPAAVAEEIHEARMTWKRRTHSESFREYEKVLVLAYEAALQTMEIDTFNLAIDKVFNEYKDQVYTYTRDLIRELKGQDYLLFAISGSPQEIVSKLADYYGFDDAIGQVFEQQGGKFTGQHTKPMFQKDMVLKELLASHDVTWDGSVAVGDSESDIVMLELVERPIAFNPTQGLFDHATAQNWQVVVERKNVVYKLEGRDGSYVLAQAN